MGPRDGVVEVLGIDGFCGNTASSLICWFPGNRTGGSGMLWETISGLYGTFFSTTMRAPVPGVTKGAEVEELLEPLSLPLTGGPDTI